MSEPFLSEIRVFAFAFAPRGWAACDGQLLPINQYQALFSLLGTMYGGDGRTTFALPDLRGRVPRGFDTAATIGARTGSEMAALVEGQLPLHKHLVNAADGNASGSNPASNNYPSAGPANGTFKFYHDSSDAALNVETIGLTGGGREHNNIQPSLVVNYCIALQGVFPSR